MEIKKLYKEGHFFGDIELINGFHKETHALSLTDTVLLVI